MSATTTRTTLDCGHAPSPHSEHTTGTAHHGGKEICWDCANVLELADMREHQDFFGYLSGDGKRITTWTGYALANVTTRTESKHVGFYGYWYKRTYFRATDVDGNRWHGISPGNGMYARMHRAKGGAR